MFSRTIKHPLRRDRIRYFITQRSLKQIILIFILVNFFISLLIYFILDIYSNYSEYETHSTLTFINIYSSILGITNLYEENSTTTIYIFSIICSYISVIFPATFLGALVFKIIHPSRKLLEFSKKIEYIKNTNKINHIETNFYIASYFQVVDMHIQAFIKFYVPKNNDGSKNYFPFCNKKLHVNASELPHPFSVVPTLVAVPEIDNNDKGGDHCHKFNLEFDNNDELISIKIDEYTIEKSKNAYCELFISVKGYIPETQKLFIEDNGYDLFKILQHGPTQKFSASFDMKKNRYNIGDWKYF